MKMKYTITLLFSLLFMVGCFVDVGVNCKCRIRTYEKLADGAVVSAKDLVAYGFAVDTTVWRVPSYESAVAGSITSLEGAGERSYDQMQYQSSDGSFELLFTDKKQMVVVADVVEKNYAWRGVEVPDNLDRMDISVSFDEAMSDTTLFYSGWWFVYGAD